MIVSRVLFPRKGRDSERTHKGRSSRYRGAMFSIGINTSVSLLPRCITMSRNQSLYTSNFSIAKSRSA